MPDLSNKKIAIAATNGFEYVELAQPKRALQEAGATVEIVSPEEKEIRGVDHLKWREDTLPVDVQVFKADPNNYHALLLPGGVINPNTLRLSKDAISFIESFVDSGKPIAAICHGLWTLIDAEGVKGKRITSWPSLRTDLENAGAIWLDERVVVDGKLVTSRKPDDMPVFNEEVLSMFEK